MSIKLDIDELDSPELGQLYYQYAEEGNPLGAFVQMTEFGVVTADHSYTPKSFVPDVHHMRVLRWEVPSEVNGQALFNTLNSELVIELLQRVYDGYTVNWVKDRRSNDEIKVGTLNEDAEDAFDELRFIFDQVECDYTDRFDDLVKSDSDLQLYWPSGPIEEGVKNLEAAAEGFIAIDSPKDALLNYVETMFENSEPGLHADHLAALIECELITSTDAEEYKAAMVEDWEAELEEAGLFGKPERLVDLYKRAPANAPSLSILKEWLESNGIDLS